MVYFIYFGNPHRLFRWNGTCSSDWHIRIRFYGDYVCRCCHCNGNGVIMRNYYLKDLKELSNQELLEMRDTAYEEELRLKKSAWRYGSKTSLSRRVTSCANEMGRRMIEGTMEFNDEGELV